MITYLLSAPMEGTFLEDRDVIHLVPTAVATALRTVHGTKALGKYLCEMAVAFAQLCEYTENH